jgi:hypothetical protein
MRKALVLIGLLALAGAASAQTFVWPQKWTVAKPQEAKRGGTLRAAVISDYRTFNPSSPPRPATCPASSLEAGAGDPRPHHRRLDPLHGRVLDH